MIELRGISRVYPMGEAGVQALRDVSLTIESGEFTAIMGPSGSGKSTLLHILGFLDRPDSGTYFLDGRDISRMSDDELSAVRGRAAGFVFQQFNLLRRSTALRNVELPLMYAGDRGRPGRGMERLREVGLEPRAYHEPGKLSGGEQQRVAIARALINDPPIIFADEPTGNLDTRSEDEIMRVLEDLNRKGKTIILVTHEREVAERAGRIILMRDGKIVSDVRKTPAVPAPPKSVPAASIWTGASGHPASDGRAEWADHLREALRSIFSNKLRSALSMLGILIGVAAVIAMLALGEGAKQAIAQRLASLGSNLLMVRPGSPQMRGVSMEAGSVTRFTLQDAAAIAELPEVRRVSPSVRGRGQLVAGGRNWNSQIQGVSVDYEPMRSATPTLGRFFTEEEVLTRERVALLGTTTARGLFGSENPVGQTVKINRVNFRVIGLLPSKGSGGWGDDDDTVVVPITTAMYRLLGKPYVDMFDVEVRSPGLMPQAQESIRRLIIRRLRLIGPNQDSFQIRDMTEIQQALESTTRTMTMLLGSIAAISLLVGGIGIMNIMLVSVTERTREIGLRKAIGARRADITGQFLVESVAMTLAGGLIGVLLGTAVAFSLSAFAGWTTRVTPGSVILASVFSGAVGIVFGWWPARQAARLDPIRALRYE
jgi:macrolide transport system ATP-binding/permease protein